MNYKNFWMVMESAIFWMASQKRLKTKQEKLFQLMHIYKNFFNLMQCKEKEPEIDSCLVFDFVLISIRIGKLDEHPLEIIWPYTKYCQKLTFFSSSRLVWQKKPFVVCSTTFLHILGFSSNVNLSCGAEPSHSTHTVELVWMMHLDLQLSWCLVSWQRCTNFVE